MKRRALAQLALALLIPVLAAGRASAAAVVAFGYLANDSQDRSYDYLETLFPNSFATALGSVYDVRLKKPKELDDYLKGHYNTALKRHYENYEIPELIDRIGGDIFIGGNFTPMPENQISITMSIYIAGTKEVFTFTNVGSMETEIFRLVDRISLVVLEFLQDDRLFNSAAMRKRSRVAVMTNLGGPELNELYATLLKREYRVMALQNTELKNYMKRDGFDRLKYVSSVNNSYDTVSDPRKLTLRTGTWAGRGSVREIEYVKKIYRLYDLDFLETSLGVLSGLRRAFNDNLDYLLIMGFDDGRNGAWARCVDMKRRELIWMKANIPYRSGDRVADITGRMIDQMLASKKNPFAATK